MRKEKVIYFELTFRELLFMFEMLIISNVLIFNYNY
jgi:hypothetical protein